MAESRFCDIKCNWKVTSQHGWKDVCQYFLLDDDSDANDELRDSDDVIVELQPINIATPQCDVTISCHPEYCVSSIVVVSDSRTQELYDQRGDYVQTFHATIYSDDVSGLMYVTVFQFDVPVCGLKLKFLCLESRERCRIGHFVVHFCHAPNDEVTSVASGEINYDIVRRMLQDMGGNLPDGVENLINNLELHQKNSEKNNSASLMSNMADTFGVTAMQSMLSRLNPFRKVDDKSTENKKFGQGDSAGISQPAAFDPRLLTDLEWRLCRRIDYLEERLMSFIDDRIIQLENRVTTSFRREARALRDAERETNAKQCVSREISVAKETLSGKRGDAVLSEGLPSSSGFRPLVFHSDSYTDDITGSEKVAVETASMDNVNLNSLKLRNLLDQVSLNDKVQDSSVKHLSDVGVDVVSEEGNLKIVCQDVDNVENGVLEQLPLDTFVGSDVDAAIWDLEGNKSLSGCNLSEVGASDDGEKGGDDLAGAVKVGASNTQCYYDSNAICDEDNIIDLIPTDESGANSRRHSVRNDDEFVARVDHKISLGCPTAHLNCDKTRDIANYGKCNNEILSSEVDCAANDSLSASILSDSGSYVLSPTIKGERTDDDDVALNGANEERGSAAALGSRSCHAHKNDAYSDNVSRVTSVNSFEVLPETWSQEQSPNGSQSSNNEIDEDCIVAPDDGYCE